jgi:tRNA(Ile)-lysidine synthase
VINLFTTQIENRKLFKSDDRVLLAVSGGVDSVVMAFMFHEAGFRFAIAHCNFGLRGFESDEDERFVSKLADQLKVDFHVKHFDTADYAKQYGMSIQMAARDLRYYWFEEIRERYGFKYIATGHHSDDHAETVILNIVKGTGLTGLQGIKASNGKIIRPLWHFSRQQILQYAQKNGISFREDSSNPEIKYLRNKIRHKVVPVLKEMNPSFTESIANLSEHSVKARETLSLLIRQKFDPFVEQMEDQLSIAAGPLLSVPHPDVVLYEYLKDYGFSGSIIKEIADALQKQPGKRFFSEHYVCLKDRDQLIVSPISKVQGNETFFVNEDDLSVSFPSGKLYFALQMDGDISSSLTEAFLDRSKITFPMVLRQPRHGDWFIPLGMKGRKKISDFLTDTKMPLTLKNQVWLLCSGESICWVVGMRIDNRFRINLPAQNVLHIKFEPVNQ